MLLVMSDGVEGVRVSAETVAGVLRKARRQRKMSQQMVADLIGTTQGRVSNWETGLRRPMPENARKWAAVFDFDLEVDGEGRRHLVPRG